MSTSAAPSLTNTAGSRSSGSSDQSGAGSLLVYMEEEEGGGWVARLSESRIGVEENIPLERSESIVRVGLVLRPSTHGIVAGVPGCLMVRPMALAAPARGVLHYRPPLLGGGSCKTWFVDRKSHTP